MDLVRAFIVENYSGVRPTGQS